MVKKKEIKNKVEKIKEIVLSKAFSFEGFDKVKFFAGAERAAVALIGILLTVGSDMSPGFAASISILGLTSDRLYALCKYWVQKKVAK